MQIHTVTTGKETALSIHLQNPQGSNPVDNTGGSTFFLFSSFNASLPDGWDGWTASSGLEGSVDVFGTPRAEMEMWRNPGQLYLTFIDEADSPIFGCDVPWEVGQHIPEGAVTHYTRTCPREGLDGWFVLNYESPEPFTALDMDFSWLILTSTHDIASCTPSNPESCVYSVPEPPSLLLLAAGLLGLGVVGVRRRRLVLE